MGNKSTLLVVSGLLAINLWSLTGCLAGAEDNRATPEQAEPSLVDTAFEAFENASESALDPNQAEASPAAVVTCLPLVDPLDSTKNGHHYSAVSLIRLSATESILVVIANDAIAEVLPAQISILTKSVAVPGEPVPVTMEMEVFEVSLDSARAGEIGLAEALDLYEGGVTLRGFVYMCRDATREGG